MLTVSVVLVCLAASLLLMQFLGMQRKRRQLPPGPAPLPLFGNLLQMKFQIHHDILNQMASTYGNIFTLWLTSVPVVVLQGYQAVKEGMTAHAEEVAGRPLSRAFKFLTNGNGVMFSNGHLWKQQRRFGLLTMRKLGVGKQSQECQIQEEARHLVQYLRNTKGKPVDPTVPVTHAVSNVISALILGHRFSIEDKRFLRLVEAVDDISAFTNSISFYVHDRLPWIATCFLTRCKKALASIRTMRALLEEEIESHKEKTDGNQDFIGYYLDQMAKSKEDAGATYDKANLTQNVFDLFLAGTETTATTLRWALLYMVAYPDVQEKVHKELDAVLGSSRLICYTDRKNLPYTNAVIHEIQRYSNIVLIALPRYTVKDTELLGFPIPKDTIVLVNIDSILSDPEKWETPDQFNPGHFLDKDGNFVHREAFLPFSIGHRACMGELLARLELFIIFCTLMQAFTFTLPDGVKEVNTKFVFSTTMKPPPHQLCAIPR
ncbi:cytochrome P450 2J6-like [Centrocercus urophasianus]|uniref:cytochrome P450 2J6-like n=1 Tax=Centrocercus urophasianus TaxID=9002 RepID=UPI001C64AE4A|nr:cytochrome P450 2J6-like [Centrocercus urophasianus]